MIAATIASGHSQLDGTAVPRKHQARAFIGNREWDVNRGREMQQRNLHHEVNSLTIKGGVYHDDEMRAALGVETGWRRSRRDALVFV
jgi:hypothetical protein